MLPLHLIGTLGHCASELVFEPQSVRRELRIIVTTFTRLL